MSNCNGCIFGYDDVLEIFKDFAELEIKILPPTLRNDSTIQEKLGIVDDYTTSLYQIDGYTTDLRSLIVAGAVAMSAAGKSVKVVITDNQSLCTVDRFALRQLLNSTSYDPYIWFHICKKETSSQFDKLFFMANSSEDEILYLPFNLYVHQDNSISVPFNLSKIEIAMNTIINKNQINFNIHFEDKSELAPFDCYLYISEDVITSPLQNLGYSNVGTSLFAKKDECYIDYSWFKSRISNNQMPDWCHYIAAYGIIHETVHQINGIWKNFIKNNNGDNIDNIFLRPFNDSHITSTQNILFPGNGLTLSIAKQLFTGSQFKEYKSFQMKNPYITSGEYLYFSKKILPTKLDDGTSLWDRITSNLKNRYWVHGINLKSIIDNGAEPNTIKLWARIFASLINKIDFNTFYNNGS